MSDIGFDGLGSFLAGVVFLGLAALLLLPLLGLVVFELLQKRPPFRPAVLGLTASTVVLGVGGALVMLFAEEAPRTTDDTWFLWGPGVLFFALVSGGGAWLASRAPPT